MFTQENVQRFLELSSKIRSVIFLKIFRNCFYHIVKRCNFPRLLYAGYLKISIFYCGILRICTFAIYTCHARLDIRCFTYFVTFLYYTVVTLLYSKVVYAGYLKILYLLYWHSPNMLITIKCRKIVFSSLMFHTIINFNIA